MLDIKGLKRELTEAGVFERREAQTWGKMLFLFAILIGLFAAHIALPFWLSAALVPVTALISVTIAMIGHEGGHRALSRSRFRNDLMLHLAFPIFGGLGALYWKWKHNVKHHAHPNIIGQDPDVQLFPMTSNRADHLTHGPARRWFQRHCQGYAFWPLTFMLTFSMRAASLEYLYTYARKRGTDRKWWVDVGALTLHYTAWAIVPTLIFGWTGLAFYVAIWTIGGAMLAAVFAPAHMSMPILTDHSDKWRLQLETSRNLRMPGWLSWFFIGLDFQIEHHLFPRIPHQNARIAAPIVRRWAARNGAPYYVVNYGKGLTDVTRYMANAWRLDPLDEKDLASWQLERSEWDASGTWVEDEKPPSIWQRLKTTFSLNLPGPAALTER